MSHYRALRIGMIGDHDVFSPCIQAGVDVVRWPRWRLYFSAPGQMDTDNTIIIQPKERVVSPLGVGNRRKSDSV